MWISHLQASLSAIWVLLLPAFILGGIGSGLVNPPIATVAVSTVSRDRVGIASGVSGACRQVGTAFLGATLTNQYNTTLHDKISQLMVPSAPPAAQPGILNEIITNLQKAGVFAGSTGLKNPPPQFAQFAHSPLFPQIQSIVGSAFINGTIDIFYLAAVLPGLGLVASLFLIRRKDMQQTEPAEKRVAAEVL